MTPAPSPRHGYKIESGRATGPLCGAEFFQGYASSRRENVACSACLALMTQVQAPEPVIKPAPAVKKVKISFSGDLF